MEDRILEIIKEQKRALSVHELEMLLGLNSVNDLKELLKSLNFLEENAKVYHTKKNNSSNYNKNENSLTF